MYVFAFIHRWQSFMWFTYFLQKSEVKSSPNNGDNEDKKYNTISTTDDKPVHKKKSTTKKYVAEEETFHGFEVGDVKKFEKKAKKEIKKINHVMNDYANDKMDELDVQIKLPTGKCHY